ncbi:ABC transporter permease [Paraburkholderia sp. DHOC27]|uniref:ABC transporter permease n=1 Tax=Paraburkholderia sp. DHOC27 TaxID=2303330 RepID=UPI000E3E8717|nr:ABC transporter permease [Paraburkholderia sp. DHOC27]RFU49115.1 ABC transporter permease [Paraburkholderia sp. DHOC27]
MSKSHSVGSQGVTLGRSRSLPLKTLQNMGPLIALFLMIFAFQITTGSFVSIGNFKSILEAAAVPAILAVGISFVILLGAIDLSVQGIIAAASMTLSLLVANGINGNNFGLGGICIAILVGVAFGALNGVLHVVGKTPSLIVTLGTWFIGLGVAAVLFPDRVPTIHEPLVLGLTSVHIAGLSLNVFIALGVIAAAHAVLKYTRVGRMIYAIGGDEGIVVASGIPVKRYKFIAFVISGGIAALAGILLSGQLGNGNADIGAGQLFPAISAAVVGGTLLSGGRGGALQSALGALILEVLGNGLIQIGAGPYSRNIFSGAVILVAVSLTSYHLRRKLRVVK